MRIAQCIRRRVEQYLQEKKANNTIYLQNPVNPVFAFGMRRQPNCPDIQCVETRTNHNPQTLTSLRKPLIKKNVQHKN